jgi:GMP synthase (glutamine-hydrolysing)
MHAKNRVAVVNCGSTKVPQIVRIVEGLGAHPYVIRPTELSAIETNLPKAIIISGNPALVQDTGTDFLTEFEILRTLTVPILGICFGHQVLGLLHGAKVALGKEDREMRALNICSEDPLFNNITSSDQFQQDHTEEVSLPSRFIHLASSSHCLNEAMRHPALPVYGVQFHPESSGKSGERLLENFVSIVKD